MPLGFLDEVMRRFASTIDSTSLEAIMTNINSLSVGPNGASISIKNRINRNIFERNKVDELSNKIEKIEEFQKIREIYRFFITSSVTSMESRYIAEAVLYSNFINGSPIYEILRAQIKFLCGEPRDISFIMFLSGISVGSDIFINDDISLRNLRNISEIKSDDMAAFQFSGIHLNNFSALHFRFKSKMEPEIGNGCCDLKLSTPKEYMDEILRACFASGLPVQEVGRAIVLPPDLRGLGSPVFEKPALAPVFYEECAMDDQKGFASTARKYLALDDGRRAKLRIPLERLNAAAREVSSLDKSIDLGIALESLLFEKEEKNSIGDKISIKYANILKNCGFDEIESKNKMNEFYEVRSKAVHLGSWDILRKSRSYEPEERVEYARFVTTKLIGQKIDQAYEEATSSASGSSSL